MPQFKTQVLRYELLPSTNLEAAKRAIEGAPEGLCVIAAGQTAGRGRQERQWVSPKDAGLYFSIVLRPALEQKMWPLLTLMTALAVQDALLDSCELQTDIKWPNDVLFNEKKLSGILAETVESPDGRALVVGIGINLSRHSFPSELESVATSVEAATGNQPNLEVVLQALARSLETRYPTLQTPNGPIAIAREWCARSSYCQGKRIRVSDGDESFVGTTRGLEGDGALRVETDGGEIRIVRAADVTGVRSEA